MRRILWLSIFTMGLAHQGIARADDATGTQVAQGNVQKIYYRTVPNTGAYKRQTDESHIAIKVTPPEVKGPDQFVYVEIYNYSKTNLELVEFDIVLQNKDGYDLATHINGDAISVNYSGVRKIATPGSGIFPQVVKVSISALKVVDDNASFTKLPVYVDLVKVVPGLHPNKKKGAPAAKPAAPAAQPAAAPAKK